MNCELCVVRVQRVHIPAERESIVSIASEHCSGVHFPFSIFWRECLLCNHNDWAVSWFSAIIILCNSQFQSIEEINIKSGMIFHSILPFFIQSINVANMLWMFHLLLFDYDELRHTVNGSGWKQLFYAFQSVAIQQMDASTWFFTQQLGRENVASHEIWRCNVSTAH